MSDPNNGTEAMAAEDPGFPGWAEPLAITSYAISCITALITIASVYAIYRYEVLKSKRSAVVFLVLSGSGFALTQMYYGFLSYIPFAGDLDAFSYWQPPFYYLVLPLRWSPITILYLRLTICYYGYPRVYPSLGWVSGASIQAARPGLKFMLIALFALYTPYFVLYFIHLGATLTMPVPEAEQTVGIVLWRVTTGFDFFYLFMSVLMGFLLFLERKSLRNYDLDQSKKLIAFFVMFIGYYIYAFSIDNGWLEPTFPVIFAIHVWLLVMSLFVFYIWYLNVRALAARRRTVVSTVAGTERGRGTQAAGDDNDDVNMYDAGSSVNARRGNSAVVVELAVIPDDQPKLSKQN